MSWPEIAIPAATALLGGTGAWAFLIARRNTSGNIANTSADKLWEANNEHNLRLSFRIDALEKDAVSQREAVRDAEKRLLDCENDRAGLAARLTQIEAENSAATIIERANVEAAKIRAEAADAKTVITTAATAAAEVVSDTATTTASELAKPPHEGGSPSE